MKNMTETNRIQEHQETQPSNRINGASLPSAPSSNGSSSKFRIAADVIAQTCDGLPSEQAKALKWAEQYCRLRNLSTEEFGALLVQPGPRGSTYSGDSVYAAFTGRREVGSLERFCAAVHTLRKRVEETKTRSSFPFVETGMTRKVFEACRVAMEKRRIVFVFGETQTGKSRSLNEFAVQNPESVRLIMMPTKPTLTELLHQFAVALGIPVNSTKAAIRRTIFDRFDENTLLIVDECERCVERAYGTDALDFLREVYERCKCGIVLAGAMNLRNAVRSIYTLKKLWLRGYRPVSLPDRPGRKALDCFARAVGLEPAADKTIAVTIAAEGERIVGNPFQIQEEVISKSGLGRWLMILEDAQDSANEAGATISWGRVIAAHHNIASFEAVTD
ncbi:MAG: hypothetical protein ABS95_01195 [Verrucomicrobia bacterium SCN 57-15]|nr:MAG: hypothetical protein ABS95_01195 [Verrucomicrobia bacterium SCN 57-15]